MPRRPGIQPNGVPLHIVQRGHNREPCFFSEEDYSSYLHWLGEAPGQTDKSRQIAYRALFHTQLDSTAIDNIRLALNQNQPLGNARFYAKIEKATGVRREARLRGRPRLRTEAKQIVVEGQGMLKL